MISLLGRRKKQEPKLVQPPWFMGSLPEWLVYDALLKMGMKDQFTFQSSRMGGRQSKGGVVLDFFFPDLRLAINVQSTYFHYRTAQQRMNDSLQRAQLEGMGIRVIYIQEEQALANASYYVKDALMGIEH